MHGKITATWLTPEKTILHQVFGEQWTLDAYWENVAEVRGLIASVPHLVCLISTFEGKLLTIPDGFISALRRAAQEIPANEGMHAVVNTSFIVQTLYRLGRSFNRGNEGRIILVRTFDEGLAHIERYRQSHLVS